ncbi:MAG TPA: prephenate dehydratase [Polyangiaceae bacterium]|jgi:chorismate mutase/prephenate dehydratase
MSVGEYRKRIDSIDDQLLALLGERAKVAEEIGVLKRTAGQATLHDPEREEQVLARLMGKGAGTFPPSAIRSVFREVISACLSLEQPVSVSFLGPEGTFSHMAARHLFGLAARYREATTIAGVFDAVRAGDASYGVVPIENSTEGSVTPAADALIEGDLVIRQELVLDVAHVLLGRPGLALGTIERVYSHPQALAQCRVWLAKNVPSAQLVQTASTVAACHEALADERGAAIGSRLAAELLELEAIRDGIHDRPENATRFFVIAKRDAPRTGKDKTTLAFSIKDGRGVLRSVLGVFDDAGINLTRIESRPSRQKRWDYVFLADLEGHREDEAVARAISQLGERCDMVKVLGSYPRRD